MYNLEKRFKLFDKITNFFYEQKGFKLIHTDLSFNSLYLSYGFYNLKKGIMYYIHIHESDILIEKNTTRFKFFYKDKKNSDIIKVKKKRYDIK